MFNLQGSEIIVILLLALVVLGPEKLPDAVRKFTQTYAELKKMGTGFQSELKSALDEPMREMRETADLVMNAADPQKLAEEAEAEVAARASSKDDAPIDERAFLVNDPGFERAAADVDAPTDDDTAPINQIAAANASAAINAAARDALAADDDALAADDGPADPAPDDGPADPAPDTPTDVDTADVDTADVDTADVDTADVDTDVAVVAVGEALERPTGPAFHSAAPQRRPDADAVSTNGPAGEADLELPTDANEEATAS